MKEYPFIFCGDMIRALLHNEKTETRRIPTYLNCTIDGLKVSKKRWKEYDWGNAEIKDISIWGGDHHVRVRHKKDDTFHRVRIIYEPGDLIWAKETYVLENPAEYITEITLPTDRPVKKDEDGEGNEIFLIPHYRATEPEPNIVPDDLDDPYDDRTRWISSIFMPKWAARIWREMTEARFERLQDITDEGIIKEGVIKREYRKPENGGHSLQHHFIILWNSINEKRGYGWEKNPIVIAINFKEFRK
ncbi:MAG: hypothetical protein A2V66_16775 [Ignavibacteria bacterium RBG_13_36_8]|nr:MAG: hypothetical protein A2V66_16775 [Ignavibacteria bacterium RBG_13_36_8]